MRVLGLVTLVLLGIAGLLLAAACQQAEPKATPVSIVKGGLIYDKWWKALEGASEPKGNQVIWSRQTTNKRTGGDTWRCKECHGWDYKGKDGAYGKGSHLTGFPGVLEASLKSTKDQLLNVLLGKSTTQHDFSGLLTKPGVQDVVNFLKEGVIDAGKYIDAGTKKATGANLARGKDLYGSTCAACHGADGKTLLFDGKDTLGFLANDNPWETLHKIRFGQPGSPMPAGVASGWSVQDAVDVLGFSQSLPAK